MAQLSCPVTGCRFVVQGINKEEVLKQMARHRRRAHERREGSGLPGDDVK
ncbi:MAG TPA: DUF1059 domain-containing protein [Methanocella sp.]|nr:DUF1059 domain-containing protein [Methanocella sp.]